MYHLRHLSRGLVLLLAGLACAGQDHDWDQIEPSRDLVYHDCFHDLKCARLLVPLDWFKQPEHRGSVGHDEPPDHRTAAIAIVTLPAKVPANDSRFGGSVLVNPGGPGSSGAEFVQAQGRMVQDMLDVPSYRHYEIVGFDPRGVGNTTPRLKCRMNQRQRDMWEVKFRAGGGDSGVGHAAPSDISTGHTLAMMEVLYKQCFEDEIKASNATSYTGTVNVARDMVEMLDRIDRLRQKEHPHGYVGQNAVPRLQYLGFSYGTFLGITFMSMFPGRVGRMVLDGVVDAHDFSKGDLFTNTAESDKIFHKFWKGCLDIGYSTCPFGGDSSFNHVIKAQGAFWKWINKIETNPLVVQGPMNNTFILTGNDLRQAVGAAAYQPWRKFPVLANLLYAAMAGTNDTLTGEMLASAFAPAPNEGCGADADADADAKGSKDGGGSELTGSDLMSSVICADGDDVSKKPVKWWMTYLQKQEFVSRVFGRTWALTRIRCHSWPFKPNWRFTGPFHAPEADHAGRPNVPVAPILFLSSRLDPVTPLRSAREMAKHFPGSRIIIQEGIGHTALGGGGSKCLKDLVSGYFETGNVPSSTEVVCPAKCGTWDRLCNENQTAMDDGIRYESSWRLRLPGHL